MTEPVLPLTIQASSEDVLASRAYLLSWREQTLPARRWALEDARQRFLDAVAADDAAYRDAALLGLIGDGMQILEDVANLGTAFESPLGGMPHYVTATVYSATRATGFYTGIPRWSDERIKVLAALWMRDPATHIAVPAADLLQLDLAPEDAAAIKTAEQATIKLLRPYLTSLSGTWNDYRRYYHAFKHGLIFLNREDFSLTDGSGADIEPSIAIWRHRGTGDAHGDTNLTPEEVGHQIQRAACLAADVASYLIDARLRVAEHVTITHDGGLGIAALQAPWEFWLHGSDLSTADAARLRERFGIDFERSTEISRG